MLTAAPSPVAATVTSAPGTFRYHIARTLQLAFPVMLGRAGILVLVAVDSAMTGHAGVVELAYYALAMAPQVWMMLVGIGLLLGTVVLTAQAEGAGRSTDCGSIWRVALRQAFGYGLILLLLCQFGEPLLSLLGQTPTLAHGGGVVLALLGWSVPAMLAYTVTTLFLEGINRPLPGLVVMILANLLNVLLNWLLIYGHWGLPAMGAAGAALATTIVRWFMFLALAGFVLRYLDQHRYNVRGPLLNARAIGQQLRRIGYPMGVSQGLESGAFAAMVLLAGLLGPLAVAAYQVAMTLVALVFMCALGFATAASVRVANAVGRHSPQDVRRAGWTAVGLVVFVLAAFAVLFDQAPEILAGLYTDDPAVLPLAVAAIATAALVLVPDGIQAVLMGALRGIADVWPATLLYLIAFWLVMLPLGYWLGVVQHGGAAGLMQGVAFGCAIAALLLAVRFYRASRIIF